MIESRNDMIQDIYPHKFHNEYRPDRKPQKESRMLCFHENRVLAREEEGSGLAFPMFCELEQDDFLFDALAAEDGKHVTGSLTTCCKPQTAEPVYAFCVDETEYFLDFSGHTFRAEGYEYYDIRNLRNTIDNVNGMIMFTGVHLYQWYRQSRFCGCCGSKTMTDEKERAMRCPACGNKIYPRLQPAVIVGVLSGDRLLVTKYRESINYYALVAGFSEIGETLEETVQREVMEEAGLKVKNIRYYKSQPWGIAQDLLAGFYCEVDGDDQIHMDEHELKLAEWKRREEIELQPNSYSLTNEMMKRFKDGYDPVSG